MNLCVPPLPRSFSSLDFIILYFIFFSFTDLSKVSRLIKIKLVLQFQLLWQFKQDVTLAICIFSRLSTCKYARIGCPWKGPNHELREHEAGCQHPHKSGDDIMDAVACIDQRSKDETQLYSRIFSLLSCEKITFNDLQLKPYRSWVYKIFIEIITMFILRILNIFHLILSEYYYYESWHSDW